MKEEYDKGLHDLENFEEISNLCESSKDELEVDDFMDSTKKINNFAENLYPKTNKERKIEHNKLIRVILYAIRFGKENKKDICDKDEFIKAIDESLFEQLDEEKYKFILDLQKFHNNCYEINSILSKYNYFLRIFELKNKFRQLSMKEPKKQNLVRQISSFIIEKYNGFQAISIEYARKQRKNFTPIDIIYKPTKQP